MPVTMSRDSAGPWPLITCDHCKNHVYKNGTVLYRSILQVTHSTPHYTLCTKDCVHAFMDSKEPYPSWGTMTLEAYLLDLLHHSAVYPCK